MNRDDDDCWDHEHDEELALFVQGHLRPVPHLPVGHHDKMVRRMARQRRQNVAVRTLALLSIMGFAWLATSHSMSRIDPNRYDAERVVVDSFAAVSESLEGDDSVFYQ